tara:strand:- start:4402 stop:7281 length:2880 start_codon:yes stop_codon:yes gene_type:complete
MKKIIILLSVLIYSSISFSQILITDPDIVSPALDCALNSGPTPNFFDSGNAGNYSPNENETIVICPDYAVSTSKLSISFGTGGVFDVDGSDTIFVYDGSNTSAPLLGAHNSITDPTGFSHVSSFANNPTGCLTIRFKSDGTTEGAGWDATLACVQPAQPIDMHMEGYHNGISNIITPTDTGYADVCFGDSILFVASPTFPYSFETTGNGYSQTTTNVTYEWEFSDGTIATNDSVWFTPPARQGYLVSLKITDQFPQSQTIVSKVRVSTIPSFSGVLITRDSICLGDTTVIIGAVTNTDTSGVDPTTSSFQLGGSVAGLVYLPDGNGISYNDTLNISGFLPGDTVTSISDVEQLCLNMEHSFLGDLEMQLTCPNGTIITIFNGNTGGIIPGGFGGGSTYLGHPIDDNLGSPGAGEEYCWSSTLATYGDFPTEFGAANFVALTTPTSPSAGNSMNWNGIYLPEQSFTALNGCPLNGDWSITIRDNAGIDDGYIFEWGILFNPLLNPNNETYVPSIVSSQWLSAASILPGLPTDTFIIVSSNTAGTLDYIFQVTDNFGCVYDTTVQVEFIGLPTTPNDTGICDTLFQIGGVSSLSGGFWNYTGPGTINFTANDSVENPLVSTITNGVYTFSFTDIQCALTDSFDINFIAIPIVQNNATICSSQYQITGTSSYDGGSWTYTGPGVATFSPSDTVENPTVNVSVQGNYTFTFVDNECGLTNNFDVNFIPKPTMPSDFTQCKNNYQLQGLSSFNGGIWSGSGPGSVSFSPSTTDSSPLFTVSQTGRYTITFTDNECATDTSFEYYFPHNVTASIFDSVNFCLGDEEILDVTSQLPEASYIWSTGETTPTIKVSQPGVYDVTVTGLCNSAADTSYVNTIICNISAPNVITPNGDGQNDFLTFEGIEHFPGSKLEVFTRWGQRIYENTNYKNDWSPTDVNAGTYYYIFTPGGELEAEILPVSFSIFK